MFKYSNSLKGSIKQANAYSVAVRKKKMGKRGPKPWQPTDDNIKRAEYLGGIGAIMDEIAGDMGVSENTMRTNSDILTAIKRGRDKFKVGVKGKLGEAIKNGNMTAIIFYLKTQCGWKEQHQISGDPENPIVVKDKFDSMPTEELRKFVIKQAERARKRQSKRKAF